MSFLRLTKNRSVESSFGTLRSRTRRLLGRGDRAKAWNEDGVVSAGNLS